MCESACVCDNESVNECVTVCDLSVFHCQYALVSVCIFVSSGVCVCECAMGV